MSTTQQLKTKIDELTSKKTILEGRSRIDLVTSTPEAIVQNAQEQTAARSAAQQLEIVINELRQELKLVEEEEKAEGRRQRAEGGFEELVAQGDRVRVAASLLDAELTKLREMGGAIAPLHKQVTGKIALDYRLPREWRSPKVENLGNSIVVHVEARKYK